MKIGSESAVGKALRCFVVAGACASLAGAGPEGEEVVNGSATFLRNGDLTTIWAANNTIINYSAFNIGAGETVRFIQPGANARVLNRILGAEPTRIDGSLLANGQVYLVNPAGVMFGQGAVVNVGALYAAAGAISNNDFLSGVNRFTGASGSVVNHGYISGDFVALLGGRVANHGQINVGRGAVVMAAGEDILIGERLGSLYVRVEGAPAPGAGEPLASSGDAGLDMMAGDLYSLAAWNTGTIKAGTAHVEASHGRTVVSGTIDASGGWGGDVSVLGPVVELRDATIDASGVWGGGDVLIGGDQHGQGDIRTADWTLIDANSRISVDATRNGDGGRVIVWSDRGTLVDGLISARGGERGGDGGFVETSSLGGLHLAHAVDATAARGKGGQWLIDPTGILIFGGSGGTLTTGGGVVQAAGAVTSAAIGDALINAVLNSGMDLTITTSNPLGLGNGNIELQYGANIVKSMGGDATLTMLAANNIVLYGDITSTSGKLHLNLVSGDPAQAGEPGFTSVGLTAMVGSMDLNGGDLNVQGDWVYVARQNYLATPVEIRANTIDFLARNGGDVLIMGDLFFGGQLPGTEWGARIRGGDIEVHSVFTADAGSQSGTLFVNSGTLKLMPTSRFTLTGAFAQFGGPVWLGADITTTEDTIYFGGNVELIDNVALRTTDGSVWGDQTVQFNGTLDSQTSGPFAGTYDLSADAGTGYMVLNGDVGASGQLGQIDLRGRVMLLNSVYTLGEQTYVADWLRLMGPEMVSSVGGRIRVLSDSTPLLDYRGNVILHDDVLVQTAGGFGDNVWFAGIVGSNIHGEHQLTVDVGPGGVVDFADSVQAFGFAKTLGMLETHALETRFWGSEMRTVHGMRFYSPVEIRSTSILFDPTFGTAYFGGDLYSMEGRFADIEFDYRGEPEIGLGTARAPFVFTGSIGDDGTGASDRAFRAVTLGGNPAAQTTAASFVFADADLLGNGLLDLNTLDMSTHHRVVTRGGGITAASGQKITSFGDLSLLATGVADGGLTRIRFSDVNVLGAFVATAVDPDGSEIIFQVRDAGTIEGLATEMQRMLGLPVELLPDLAMEIIASEGITLSADSMRVGPGPNGMVLFASDTGAALVAGGQVVAFDGSIDIGQFRSALDPNQLYPYDLRLTFPESADDLATSFIDEARVEPEYPDRYLPEREVLEELALSPRDTRADEYLTGARTGRRVISDQPARTSPSYAGGDYALALERLSRPSVERLTDAYVAMFGERLSEEGSASTRERDALIREALSREWDAFRSAEPASSPSEFAAWLARRSDAEPRAKLASAAIASLRDLMDRLGHVEMTAFEREQATGRLLARVWTDPATLGEFRRAVEASTVVAAR